MLLDALIATPLPILLEAGTGSGPSALPLLLEIAAAGAVAVAVVLRRRVRRVLTGARHGLAAVRAR